jgi:hypothetical protein
MVGMVLATGTVVVFALVVSGEGDGHSGTTCAHGIKDESTDDGGCECCDCGKEWLDECCECGRERLGECCESESLVEYCEGGTERQKYLGVSFSL